MTRLPPLMPLPLRVACPKCGSDPGVWCWSGDRPARRLHVDRCVARILKEAR